MTTDAPSAKSEEPTHPLAKDVLGVLRASGRPLPATAVAHGLGIEYTAVNRTLHGLADLGWAKNKSRGHDMGWTAQDGTPPPGPPRRVQFPTQWSRAAGDAPLPGVPRSPHIVVVPAEDPVSVLRRLLVERAQRDPIGLALELASPDQLRAELARREAGSDALTEAGLPPAE